MQTGDLRNDPIITAGVRKISVLTANMRFNRLHIPQLRESRAENLIQAYKRPHFLMVTFV